MSTRDIARNHDYEWIGAGVFEVTCKVVESPSQKTTISDGDEVDCIECGQVLACDVIVHLWEIS